MSAHSSTSPVSAPPAHLLQGMTLPNTGWKLVQKKAPSGTGGNFGVGYLAERIRPSGKEEAFVKAIDFVDAMGRGLTHFAQEVALAYYEYEVHEACTAAGMTKIIRCLDREEIIPPCFGADNTKRVFCIIMERGEHDLRGKLKTINTPSCAWKLTVLRDVAQAMSQLHKAGLAHQDVKPSNVFSMKDNGSFPDSRVGDLGRAARKSGGPHNHWPWPGDPNYQPPERLYGHRPTEWLDEREASDAYMVGGLMFFLFSGVPLLAETFSRIPSEFQPGNWCGGYDSTIKSLLVNIQSELIENVLRPTIPDRFSDDICNIAYDLTHPEPERRGDRRARKQGLVGMDRVADRLQLLALKAEMFKD